MRIKIALVALCVSAPVYAQPVLFAPGVISTPDNERSAAFTPDGGEILSMDTTGRVTTWPATTAAWLSRACHIARRDFTPQERTLYSITPVSAKPCP